MKLGHAGLRANLLCLMATANKTAGMWGWPQTDMCWRAKNACIVVFTLRTCWWRGARLPLRYKRVLLLSNLKQWFSTFMASHSLYTVGPEPAASWTSLLSTEGWTQTCVLILARVRRFLFSDAGYTGSGTHPASYSLCTAGSFPRGKATGARS